MEKRRVTDCKQDPVVALTSKDYIQHTESKGGDMVTVVTVFVGNHNMRGDAAKEPR